MAESKQASLYAYNNQQLFSDHYIRRISHSREREEARAWKNLTDKAVELLPEIKRVFEAFTPSEIEAQTEKDLIQPILEALGHDFEVQPSLRVPDGTKTPDYVFYRDPESKNDNKGKILTDNLLREKAFAVGDAKYWDRPLDKTLKVKSAGSNVFTNENPSYQISFYIQHSGVEWGVLTNGRLWRLYHKDTAHKLNHFYEVDLDSLLKSADESQFVYFYAFFHRSAFEDHPLGVSNLLKESVNYAREVGESLKSQVYDALRHIAQGFLDYKPNNLGTDPHSLQQIYDASLIVLYRMLFLLYAEARNLLPINENDTYKDLYSLRVIKIDAATELIHGRRPRAVSFIFWSRLKGLFELINDGDEDLSVEIFNGGLFDPTKHEFIERNYVGDAHLVKVIDMLARVGGQWIDYQDLDVRHLGTIYEGLLEYHLEAIEPKDKFSIDLRNDKGQRKSTGSYYTPDYIVKYIIDQTLGPVLREAVTGFNNDDKKAAAVLALNVLDPSMGSGHFLVEATEYMARFLARELHIGPDASNDEADLDYWKRRVASSCVYGVDLNPLAVELAKLSLWLATVSKGRPLSFLDHHLRAGNSLVGARLDDLRLSKSRNTARKKTEDAGEDAGEHSQLSMLGTEAFRQTMSTAVGSMWLIEENPGLTVEDVKEQEQVYNTLHTALAGKYGRLTDLATATYFGLDVDVDPQQWNALADYATGTRQDAALPKFDEWLDAAARISNERRFFHWELEFPEVFFDRNGASLGEKAGFDVVVGNPPYVRVRTLKEQGNPEVQFLEAGFYKCAVHVWDLYLLFGERALFLAKPLGKCGLIIPIQTLHQPNCKSLRELILKEGTISEIFDLSALHIFPEALVKTCILLYSPGHSGLKHVVIKIAPNYDLEQSLTTEIDYNKLLESPDYSFKSELFVYEDILSKVDQVSETLGSVFYVTFGLRSSAPKKGQGGKDRLILPTASAAQARPYMEGREIGRYSDAWLGRFIDYKPKEMYSPRTPKLFESEKVVTQSMLSAKRLIATYDDKKKYVEQSLVCIVPRDYETREPDTTISPLLLFILALLNSKLLSFYFAKKIIGDSLGGGLIHATPGSQGQLPIRRIPFTTPADQRAALLAQAVALYESSDHDSLPAFAQARLVAQPEQSDVVHDLLAHFAQSMIDFNRQRTASVEAFTLDLEGLLSAADDLQKLHRLWTPTDDPPAEAQTLLGSLISQRLELHDHIGLLNEDQWKWLLKRRLKQVPNLAALVNVYRERQPAIAAQDVRIAATDRLIDQIVYRLYGLRDEDIALIEN